MTTKDLITVNSLMRLFDDYPTWTKDKRGILNRALEYIESGTHEYFTSNSGIHGAYIGEYYVEDKNHNRRGTLKKYRGKKVLVMCIGHGSYHVRKYVCATIE